MRRYLVPVAALVVGALGVFRLPRERTVIMGSLLLV